MLLDAPAAPQKCVGEAQQVQNSRMDPQKHKNKLLLPNDVLKEERQHR